MIARGRSNASSDISFLIGNRRWTGTHSRYLSTAISDGREPNRFGPNWVTSTGGPLPIIKPASTGQKTIAINKAACLGDRTYRVPSELGSAKPLRSRQSVEKVMRDQGLSA